MLIYLQETVEKKKLSNYTRGLKEGIPVALGYIPIAMACAILAVKTGFSSAISILMGSLVYTASGQSAALNLFQGGETAVVMYALTLFVINCRYMLFSIALAQRFEKNTKLWQKILGGILNTDEVFGVAIREKGDLNGSYLLGLGTASYVGFAAGNIIGSLVTDLLPASVSSALGIMLFAMFIAIITPEAKSSKPIAIVVLIALALSFTMECIPFIKANLSSSWIIIICAAVTSVIGALMFPVKEEEGE